MGNRYSKPGTFELLDLLPFLIISVLFIMSWSIMTGFFGNIFNLLCFAVILWFVPAYSHDFNLCENDRKTFLEIILLILFGILIWGSIFIKSFQRKLLAWMVFLLYFGLSIFILTFLLKRGYVPIPPLYFGRYFSWAYDIVFGGLAIYASVLTMKRLETNFESH
jgi:hypothetical protein